MARIADIARISIAGLGAEGIDHNSPLEEQSTLVWRAAHRYADAHNWRRREFEGHAGRAGNVVMKQLMRDLFPRAGEDKLEKISGLIGQVLKKSLAARCLDSGHFGGAGPDRIPTWWVADTMPDNLVPVAIATGKKGGVLSNGGPPPLKPTHTETKLTPQEAGEDMPPAPVTITQPEKRPRAPHIERLVALRTEKERRLLEWLRERTQPVTSAEAGAALEMHSNIARDILNGFADSGQAFRRLETQQEKELRRQTTGAAKPSYLYSTTDPVPARTEITFDGTPPADQPARDTNVPRDLESDALTVYGALVELRKGSSVTGQESIRARTGLSTDEIYAALTVLEEQKIAYKRGGRWYLDEWRTQPGRRGARARTDDEIVTPPAEVYAEPEPTPEPAPTPAPNKRAPVEDWASPTPLADALMHPVDERVTQAFVLIAEALVDASVPAAPAGPDQETIERLEFLEAEVERLNRVNDGLKQALKFDR